VSGEVQDWDLEVAIEAAQAESAPDWGVGASAGESLLNAPAIDLIAYGRILAAEHPYGSQERELLTALAEALAARQPERILVQMGCLQVAVRRALERVLVLEQAIVERALVVPRVMHRTEELAQLNSFAIIRDAAGTERVRADGGSWGWNRGGVRPASRDRYLIPEAVPLPALVIYDPTALAADQEASRA